jgi:hypothetical protein
MTEPARRICVANLKCSGCGSELSGSGTDCVFFCAGCRSAYEAGGKGLEAVPYMSVPFSPPFPETVIHRLPMWMFEVDMTAVKADERHLERAAVFFGPGRVFVPGFRMSFRGFYGDPGISLTRHWYFSRRKGDPEPVRLEAPDGGFPRACETPSTLAEKFMTPIILSIIDPVVDVTGLEIAIRTVSKALLSVAFRQEGGRVGCMNLSDVYPLHAFSPCLDSGTKK